jgi:hypothetical protein
VWTLKKKIKKKKEKLSKTLYEDGREKLRKIELVATIARS